MSSTQVFLKHAPARRLLSVFLALAMLLGLLPLSALADETPSAVIYNRKTPEVAILNAFTGNDDLFYSRKLLGNTDGDMADRAPYWQYNAVTLFQEQSTRTPKQYRDRATGEATWDFNLASGSVLKSLIQPSKNLEVSASATFYNRTHTHSNYEWKKVRTWETTITSYESMSVGIGGSYSTPIGGNKDRTRQKPRIGNYGDVGGGYKTLTYYSNNDYCRLHFYPSTHSWHDFQDRTCDCGGVYAENVLVTFRDTRAPQLVNVQYSLDGMSYTPYYSGTNVGKGRSVYVKLTFDEPIRFADDTNLHSNLYLDLQADGETAGKYRAKLTELSGSDLIFRYTVPTNQETDVRIVALDMSGLFTAEATLPLVQVGASGAFAITTQSGEGFDKSRCYVTDLAGNALNKQTVFDANLVLDSGAPCLENVDFRLSLNNADVKEALGKDKWDVNSEQYQRDYTDTSDTFLGVGDSFYLIATMNERLKGIELDKNGKSYSMNWYNAVFTTNLLDENNRPVEVTSWYFYPFRDNETEPTRFITKSITIEKGWHLADNDTQIKVIQMRFADNGGKMDEEITDLAGNALDKSNVKIKSTANANPPELDVTAPDVFPIANSYASEGEGFLYGVTLSDNASGYAGIYGSFVLNNGGDGKAYPYQWAVKADAASVVADDEWMDGVTGTPQTFRQTKDVYFHIRPVDSAAYVDFSNCTITVKAKDYAGNESDAAVPPTGSLAWYIDNLAPTAAAGGTKRTLNANGSGTLTAEVILSDGRGISAWQYAWGESADTAPAAADWQKGVVTASTTSDPVPVEATGTVGSGTLFSQYLWVRATDNSDNTNTSGAVCLGLYSYDLRAAQYELEYSTGITYRASIHVKSVATEDCVVFLVPANDDPDNNAYGVLKVDKSIILANGANIFDAGMSYYTLSESGGVYTLTEDTNATAKPRVESLGSYARNMFSGELTVTVLSGKYSAVAKDTDNGTLVLGNDANHFVTDTITLRVAGYANDLFGKITLACSDNLGKPGFLSYWTTGEGYYQRTTLAGLRFTITINGDNRGWKYENVDWRGSYIRLENAADRSKGYNIPVGPFQTPEGDPNGIATQTVTVPEGDYESGVYKATFHLALKAGRDDYDSWLPDGDTYRGIVVDTKEANSDFSLSSLLYDPQANNDHFRKMYGLDQNYGDDGRLELVSDGSLIYLPISRSDAYNQSYSYVAREQDYYVTITSPTEKDWEIVGTTSTATAYLGRYSVQLWNIANANNRVELTTSTDPTEVKTGLNANASNHLSFVFSADKQDSQHLYLAPGEVNTIAVQKLYENGRRSDIKYYQIMPVDEAIGGSIRLDRDAGQLVFTPNAGVNTVGATVFAWVWQNGQDESLGQGERVDLSAYADGTWRCALAENGANYEVLTISEHGALCEVGYLNERAPWFDDTPQQNGFHADQGVSGLNFKDNGNGTYTLTFRVRDDRNTMKNGLSVSIGFNEKYSNDTFTFTYSGTNIDWTTNSGDPTGIYAVKAQKGSSNISNAFYERDYLDVTVEGVFANITGADMDVTVTATDAFGNTGTVSSTGNKVNYAKPEAVSHTVNTAGLAVTFNQPVRPVESWAWHEKDGTGFLTEWSGAFPVSGNGAWAIAYRDVFGQTYGQEITTDGFGSGSTDYSIDLKFSTTETTDQLVTMTTNAANGTVKVYAVDGSIYTEMKPVDGYPGVGTQKRQTVIGENRQTQVELIDSGATILRLRVYIDNIVTGAPEADVRYYVDQLGQEFTAAELEERITADGGSMTVTGNVRVWYNTDRHVTPTTGGSTFLFTPENQSAAHIFAYTDDLGNAGSVTVSLPAGLMLKGYQTPPQDTTAPDVSVDIYAKRGGIYTQAESFLGTTDSAKIGEKFSQLGYVQGYSLAINASDESGFIINAAGEDAVLTGNVLTITRSGTFTITVTDLAENPNETTLIFTVPDTIDTTAPTATLTVSANGLYAKSVTIVLEDTDDHGNPVRVQDSTTGEELDTVTLDTPADARRTERNTYVYDAADNGDVQFLFRDIAGNLGTTSKLISGIDTDPPQLTVRWSPPYTYEDQTTGEMMSDDSYPTSGPVNTNITTHIFSDKAMYNLSVDVSGAVIQLLSGGQPTANNPYVIKHPQNGTTVATITAVPERVTVTYEQGFGPLKFTASAANGKTSTADLVSTHDSMDKDAPTVTQTVTTRYDRKGNRLSDPNAPAYRVEAALYPSEAVVSPNCGETELYHGQPAPVIYNPSHPLEITFTANGVHNVILNDQAGNVAIVPVTITGIDRTAPVLTVTQDAKNDAMVTIEVSEACRVAAGGAVYQMTAGTPQILRFTDNGTFEITATDPAGNESFQMVSVGSIDNVPPSIRFTSGTVYLPEGSTAEELKALLDAGCTAEDNSGIAPVVTHDGETSVDRTRAGQYTVTYTAVDEAGNQTTAARLVRVIGTDTVCLNVDGRLVMPDGTAVLRPGEHTLTLANLNAEPYTIKARKGILSAGQMKYLSGSSLRFDEAGRFTVSGTGYYTLLVTTQSRQTIRILLYIEP